MLLLHHLVHTFSKIKISKYGELGLLCDFGDKATQDSTKCIWGIREQIQSINGVLYAIHSYNTITVYFNNNTISASRLSDLIKQIKLTNSLISSNKIWEIPVCYNAGYELDLTRISNYIGLTEKETIKSHCSKPLYMHGYGAGPGQPKYGNSDLCAPHRLATPRVSIPAGSVGWVEHQGMIQANNSPGGWNIIGRTPIKMFDATSKDPCKIKPGDSIQFYPITMEEFNAYC
jgi:inhibitor of KinA